MKPGLAFDKEVNDLVKDLQRLATGMSKAKKRNMLAPAVKPAMEEAKKIVRAEARSKKVHYRYHNGEKVATYHPGNLARSIQVLKFKSPDVFVGPKRSARGAGTGSFKGRKVDGWYGHFLEFGTVKHRPIAYLRRGFDSKRAQVISILEGKVRTNITEWSRKHWEKKRVING